MSDQFTLRRIIGGTFAKLRLHDLGDGTYAQEAVDAGAAWDSSWGVSGAAFSSADASAADAALTDAPTSGESLVVTDVVISVDTTMTVILKDDSGGNVLFTFYFPASGTFQFTPRAKLKLAADKKLWVRTSAAGNISVTASYHSEA